MSIYIQLIERRRFERDAMIRASLNFRLRCEVVWQHVVAKNIKGYFFYLFLTSIYLHTSLRDPSHRFFCVFFFCCTPTLMESKGAYLAAADC